jgi:hypothetical protein
LFDTAGRTPATRSDRALADDAIAAAGGLHA